MPDVIGELDVCFVIDTTGSMTPFLTAARKHITRIAEETAKAGDLSIRMGIVEYRDHPPQDESFKTKELPMLATRTWQFTSNLKEFQSWLDQLRAGGGGDEAEAVFDGVVAATKLEWREHADRVIWLVGDSPPHGACRPEASLFWAKGCPCNYTLPLAIRELVDARVTLHAITLTDKPDLKKAFMALAKATGGKHEHHPGEASAAVEHTISAHYAGTVASVADDRLYAKAYSETVSMLRSAGKPTADVSASMVASVMHVDEATAKASHARLKKRKLVA